MSDHSSSSSEESPFNISRSQSPFDRERQMIITYPDDIASHHPFRPKCISYIIERHWHFRFQPATAYRALYYFDWFMTRYLVSYVDGAEDRYLLLAAACLFVAVEEELPASRMPSLEDLQGDPARFSNTEVQEMGREVTWRLQQNLGCVTPFDFHDYFISRLPPSLALRRVHIDVNFNFILLKANRARFFMRFRPSELAAAAVILAARQRDVELPAFYERVNRYTVAILSQQWESFFTAPCTCSDCVPAPPAHLASTVPTTGDEHSGAGTSAPITHTEDALLNVNNLFDNEHRQNALLTTNIGIHPFRRVAIRFILQRISHFSFGPATAYRALYYFDWFLSRRRVVDKSGWYVLIAVACLSVAAKEEETQEMIPSLEDLQLEGRPRARSIIPNGMITDAERIVVQQLLMDRDCIITPVDFRNYFLSRLTLPPSPVHTVQPAVHTVHTFKLLVLKSIDAGMHQKFWMSELAAAAVILAARQSEVLPDAFYDRVNRVRVATCRQGIKRFLEDPCTCTDCAQTACPVAALDSSVSTSGDVSSGAGKEDPPEGPVRSEDNLRSPDASPVVNPTVSTSTGDESSNSGEDVHISID